MSYNWQQKNWPNFQYDTSEVEEILFEYSQRTGKLSGVLETFSEHEQSEAIINLMVSEAIKTSEIEGEYLSRQDVMSSIRRNLGLNPEIPVSRDKRVEGITELMLTIRKDFKSTLSKDILFDWHGKLMNYSKNISVGSWRSHSNPMQIISGSIGKETVHFEAPPSKAVSVEMDRFIEWFNVSRETIKKPIIRSAIAHLYFESIHPFEDGNGRIGRAIAEKALSQHMGRPVLFSLSKAIEANKKAYYDALKKGQKSNEITAWIVYFVETVLSAQKDAEQEIEFTLKKTKFFDEFKNQLNVRQEKVVKRMLEAGHQGFEGGMNARKYISLTNTSKATATRDLQDLVGKGILLPVGGGRSTRYEVNM